MGLGLGMPWFIQAVGLGLNVLSQILATQQNCDAKQLWLPLQIFATQQNCDAKQMWL